MTGKIFRSIVVAVGGVLLAAIIVIVGCLYGYFTDIQVDRLWAELDMAVVGTEISGVDYLETLDTGINRITWISADGTVLYDALEDEMSMGNHADREEVREAFDNGAGQSQRYSDTLLEKTVYCAKLLSDGSVLRISTSRATMAVVILDILRPICMVFVLALIFAFWLAHHLSERIVAPLNDLDLDRPLENKTYDELAPLLTRISRQRGLIDDQVRELKKRTDEFTHITESMKEGLVLLDNKSIVLSINKSAEKLFSVSSDSIGKDFLTIERSCDVIDAVVSATETGHSEVTLDRGGRIYQVDVSRIDSDGTAAGVVLLIFDVTEKVSAERSRREFTANVSHELKTPLTTIIGSSDLLSMGMVKNEDVPRFVGHIHDEAARLLTLIEDIIRLSQLDEGVELEQESVDIAKIAENVTSELSERAARCEVTLMLDADPCVAEGVPRLFHEIIYNLTDNAIKYNKKGGEVRISIGTDGVISVSDNGIGIPPEHIDRIFERFYRVDKSHSRQTGGTGLGLSIVKHAAAYLGARIEVESKVGEGTTVRVILKK